MQPSSTMQASSTMKASSSSTAGAANAAVANAAAAQAAAAASMPMYMQPTAGYYGYTGMPGYPMPYWQPQMYMPGAMPTAMPAGVIPSSVPTAAATAAAPQHSAAAGAAMSTAGGVPARPGIVPSSVQPPVATPLSLMGKAVMEAKARMVLDTLPDDEIRRLFIVMYEHFATPDVTKAFKAQHDEITQAIEKRRAEAAETDKQEQERVAQQMGIMNLVDDDDDE